MTQVLPHGLQALFLNVRVGASGLPLGAASPHSRTRAGVSPPV